MKVAEVREKYLEFFKARGHTIIPGVPLVPENDPTTLFVSSGMQPLLPYFLGTPHPKGKRVANSQLSFRAGDIEEIGDNRHTTTFEMLGNWSFGDYFKKEQLAWFFEFLTSELGVAKDRLWVTCYEGDQNAHIPRDTDSADIWKSLGIESSRIQYYGSSKNWWTRSGTPDAMPPGEPGGPDSEVFYDFGTMHNLEFGDICHPNCDCGRFIEIGNSVFMEYVKTESGAFQKLPKQNVDFGGGLERLTAAANNTPDIFKIDTLWETIRILQDKTGKEYEDPAFIKSFRVVADHIRGAVFMITDGVLPSNTEQGYILRRLIRRAVQHMDRLSTETISLADLVSTVTDPYEGFYPKVKEKQPIIESAVRDEESRFRKTLSQGMKEFDKVTASLAVSVSGPGTSKAIPGRVAFDLFQTHGFPIEITEELARERGFTVDKIDFMHELERHQELSRKGAEQKFKGGLADTSEKTTMLHTATHLMLAGLRKYLGDHVHQAGSNITAERTRFDFTHSEKVPRDVLNKVEAYVNEAITKKAKVEIIPMKKEEAKAAGVEGSFWEKYPDTVNVYQIQAADGTIYSRELCGGPHVEETGTILGTFKIVKEEASSAGVRRVKGVLE